MENKQNNKGIIALLILIIAILSALCILFATGTISFNSDKTNNSDVNENNSNDNIENNKLATNDVFEELVGTYKYTNHSAACGDEERTLTIHNNGTADIYTNTCVGGSVAKNAIFSINEKQIYIIDKSCEMLSNEDDGSCTIGGGCYSGGCSPLWTFDYTFDGSKVTIEDFIKQ